MSGRGMGGAKGGLPFVRLRIAATSAAAVAAWGAGSGAVILSTLASASSKTKANVDAGLPFAQPWTYASWYAVTVSTAFATAGGAELIAMDVGVVGDETAYATDVIDSTAARITVGYLATGETPRVHLETEGAHLSALSDGAVEILIALETLGPDVSGTVLGAAVT